MAIILVRIDDRLIHGQVVEAWMPALRIERVLVVSDLAASDGTQKALMQLAMPESAVLEILAVRDAPAVIEKAAQSKERVMVLAPGPAEILYLLERGARFEVINVGGLHHAAAKIQLGKAIFICDEDALALEMILQKGTRLEGRSVPSERTIDIAPLIRSATGV